MSDLPGPVLFSSDEMRAALARRDISTVYRLLTRAGVSQRRIAELVGQSQSEVSEILKGRKVMGYEVLVRIAQGLNVPRGWMGLAYAQTEGEEEEHAGGLSVGEVDEDMKRRALLATGAIALLGAPVLGEVLHIPARPNTPAPLPSRLGAGDVAALRNLTGRLRSVCRVYGGGAEVVSPVAQRSLQLLSVPASEQTRTALASTLAELHTTAGWCCVDSGYHDDARAHFARSMELAADAGDGRQVGSAFHHTGIHMRDAGAYNDDLKSCQLGLMKLGDFPDSPDAVEAAAWLNAESAVALAAMGHGDKADRAIKTARERPMSNVFDDADMDYRTSCVYRHLGQVDAAQAVLTSSLHKWTAEGSARRDSVLSDIALATIHVQTGQGDAAALSRHAIAKTATLRSGRARAALAPLTRALSARPDVTSHALARHAQLVQQGASA